MAIVVDPDSLDRFQIAFDPVGEQISVRGLGDERVALSNTGDSDGSTTFTDTNATFVTDSVAAGDILTIISPSDPGVAGIIGHYVVQSITSETEIVVDRAIPASGGADLTYRINEVQATNQTGPVVADGITLQAIYSFCKEEWRTLSAGIGNAPDLIKFIFPFESITREQMEIGGPTHGDWDFSDDSGDGEYDPQDNQANSAGSPRNLVRTGGWAQITSNGDTNTEYTGIISLGALDDDAQVYYLQVPEDLEQNFVLTGPVNQAIQTLRFTAGPDIVTGFAISGSNVITRNDGGNWYDEGYRPGGYITIRSSENGDNDGTYEIDSVDDGTSGDLTVVGTPLINNANDTSLEAAVDYRRFLNLFVRKKARTYSKAEIADIGVVEIETIVNRLPLTHAVDTAITLDDGSLTGDGDSDNNVFQASEEHSSGSNGATTDIDNSTFQFVSTGVSPAFNTVLVPGDVLNITSGSYIGSYEIESIGDAQTLVCFKEPTRTYPGDETSLDFNVRTGVRDDGTSNGSIIDVDSNTGTLTDAGATFATDNGLGDRIVDAGDMIIITAVNSDGTDDNVGVYKVISVDSDTQLTIKTSDQEFPGSSTGDVSYRVKRPGMHLQFKSDAPVGSPYTSPTDGISFSDANPDTISRNDGGDFVADGWVEGQAVIVTGSENSGENDGTYVIASVAASTLTLTSSASLTSNISDTTATLTGEIGFIRILNSVRYPFNWRLFGNGGSLAETFQFLQRELRREGDIDLGPLAELSDRQGVNRGTITDTLLQFSTPTGNTFNLFIDDLSSSDFNNVTKNDLTNGSRNFAFVAGLTINLNSNLLNDSSAKVVVFFTDPDENAGSATGNEYGTIGAIVVNDTDDNEMSFTTPLTSPIQTTFDFDNNTQGGRNPSADSSTGTDVTIVAIGLETAQYVSVAGTIQRQNNNIFSLTAALERNYNNP